MNIRVVSLARYRILRSEGISCGLPASRLLLRSPRHTSFKSPRKLDLVVHTCDPSTWEAKQENCCKLKVSLIYTAGSGLQSKTLSKKKSQENLCKIYTGHMGSNNQDISTSNKLCTYDDGDERTLM